MVSLQRVGSLYLNGKYELLTDAFDHVADGDNDNIHEQFCFSF